MNKRQKEVQQAHLNNEKKTIRQLQRIYSQASKDCEAKIQELASRTDMQNLQSIVYQMQYQQALKKQLDSILDTLQSKEFDTVAEYLSTSYEDGFIGAAYDLHGQGIPLIIPIDQRQVVKAVQTDAKISSNLYSRLGEDVDYLKKSIRAELSRGISNGSTWLEMATHIANGMNSPFRKAMNNAMRIARTEGHRIQQQAQMDTLNEAQKKGADIVKQWDSTLDDRTRESHKILDGQIRELDDYFEVNGHRAMMPGGFGVASEDIHCRCCMLQRAKWALNEAELKTLQDRAAYFGLDKTADFEDFKQKYLKLPSNATTMNIVPNIVNTPTSDKLKAQGVEYNQVYDRSTTLSDDEIIQLVAGGDKTSGSCASVALAYVGQKQGWQVLDFRDGTSRDFFSGKLNKVNMFKDLGVQSLISDSAKSNLTNGKRILAQLQQGKEYYLSVGRHAAIVRNNQGTIQYLELQHPVENRNGWQDFGDVKSTLIYRFGCSSSSAYYSTAYATDISQLAGDDFRTILGYINTDEAKQKKGGSGYVR